MGFWGSTTREILFDGIADLAYAYVTFLGGPYPLSVKFLIRSFSSLALFNLSFYFYTYLSPEMLA